METKDSMITPAFKTSNNGCSLKCQSSVEYDIEVATDNGANDIGNVFQDSLETVEECDLDMEASDSSSLLDKTITPSKSDSCYTVTCTISIAMAIPKGEDEEPIIAIEKVKKKPKRVLSSGVVEAPKAQGYYHIEYNLLPDDPEPTKVDLVMFGLAAKIYMDNETKVLKPWQEADQVWMGWSQSVKLKVTRELLIKMASHKVTFRVWDTKDRVSAKARYDRPKAFRLPQGKTGEDPDNMGGIKNMVQNLRTIYEKQNPRTRTSMKCHATTVPTDLKKLSELNCATVEPKPSSSEVPANERMPSSSALNTAGSVVQDTGQLTHRSCGEQDLQSIDSKSIKPDASQEQEKESTPSKPMQKVSAQDQSLKACKDMSKTVISCMKSGSVSARKKSVFVPVKKKPAQKSTAESAALVENVRKNGVASVELSLIYLLAGDRSLTDCLVTFSAGVYDGLCNITLDRPLISEQLKAELNPLVITVLSATSLPSSPIPFHVLEEKCLPVYCQYKFHNMNVHRTKGQEHSTNVYFKDVNVILTGLLSPGELLEFLRGPPLEIEVHDRDRKIEKTPTSPALFGTEPNDSKLNNVALASSKRTTHNPFREKSKQYDPYGVAKLNLFDLLRGQKSAKLSLPIRCSPPPQLLGDENDEWEMKVQATDGPIEQPMSMGHYFDANSQLKVQIAIACPLNAESDTNEGDCPFGRVIYHFRYNNISVLTRLRSEILRINAAAFQLDSQTEETVARILSGFKMSAKETENKDLDIITGFHMLDKHIHLFVLEGLKDQAIKSLWETVPVKLDGSEEEQVTILYNSGLSFSKRLYDTLNVGLSPVHLHEPLETIMRQPLVYVRDMVPHMCFQAMSRISHLCQVKKLNDVVHSNLFPSAEMVLSLSKEFGIVPGKGEQRLMAKAQEALEMSHQHATEKPYRPLDTFNREYMEWKHYIADQQLHRHTKDFIQANIEDVQTAIQMVQRAKPEVIVAEVAQRKAAHNYSIQTMNSTAQARELLRKEMAKEPARRFSYSHEYQSATVDPQDVDAALKSSEARARAAWRTYDGFIYPGFKSSAESNEHPRQPDEARADELRKPWRENVLHGNTLRPTLTRSTRPWIERFQDFELYIKPPTVFSPVPPVTIHLAGEVLHQEQLQAARAQYNRWLRKVLPDKASAEIGRVPEFKCHMGRADLDKLQHMLKDKPMKYSLKRPGMVLKPIPGVSMVQHPGDRETSIPFAPGPFQEHSLSWDHNTIPRHSSQYNQFHFREFWMPRWFQHKRTALTLTEEEKRAHLFQTPADADETPTSAVNTQRHRNIVETRTYNDVTLHVH